MKKLKVIFTVALIAAVIGSCDYSFTEDVSLDPVTQGKVAKVFLGGNVECSQLSLVNSAWQNLTMTTGRNDYDQLNKSFAFSWPTGLEVEVMQDGSVSWALTQEFDLLGDGSCYKVGAVIVKGSTASNVFYYGAEGAAGDMGLFPPTNSSVTASALSNLTFCFVKTECPKPLIITVKSWYHMEGQSNWSDYCLSFGDKVFSAGWCGTDYMGVNSYPGTTSFSMGIPSSGTSIGQVTVGNGKIVVELYGGRILDGTYVFIGTEDALKYHNLNSDGCPIYSNSSVWQQNTTTGGSIHTFDMP